MNDFEKFRLMLKRYGLRYTCDHVLTRMGLRRQVALSTLHKMQDWYGALSDGERAQELSKWFAEHTGKTLNLDAPRTYSEKIQWLKLYDSTPLKTRLADKYRVREWVAQRIGGEYLVPLLGLWDRFDDINFNQLPDRFVLKANHGSGWNIIVDDKNRLNLVDAREKCDRWMATNFGLSPTMELFYRDIPPKLIAEKYLAQDGKLYDYKFLCFNGQVKYCWVDIDRFTDHKRNFYNLDWELMPFTCRHPISDKIIEKPVNFALMTDLAQRLCAGFIHCRVDFYHLDGKVYFGEMTFTSGSGVERWFPDMMDTKVGEMMRLPFES